MCDRESMACCVRGEKREIVPCAMRLVKRWCVRRKSFSASACAQATPRMRRSQPTHPSDAPARSSRHHRRRDDRDDDRRRRHSGSSRDAKRESVGTTCMRIARQRHCYVALLLGSVLVNMLQLMAFFASRPTNGAQHFTFKERARTSLRMLLGTVSSLYTHEPVDSNVEGASPALAGPSTYAIAPALPSHTASASMLSIHDVQLAAAPAQPLPLRHPTYRIAFTVPWIGKSFPSWFPYFLSSCRRSAFLADWLIFHEGAQMPVCHTRTPAPAMPHTDALRELDHPSLPPATASARHRLSSTARACCTSHGNRLPMRCPPTSFSTTWARTALGASLGPASRRPLASLTPARSRRWSSSSRSPSVSLRIL